MTTPQLIEAATERAGTLRALAALTGTPYRSLLRWKAGGVVPETDRRMLVLIAECPPAHKMLEKLADKHNP